MTFLHTTLALTGLACVAIPIIIHLLMRRRRRPVLWGAMRFLLEAYRKHRRRLMIEKWLLLATRCLLVLLLGLAIGRPLIGAIIGGGTGRTVYVVIDNGLAAGAIGADGQSALDHHKAAAKAIFASLQGVGGEGDRAALVALGAPAEGVVLPVSADVPAVASLLEGVECVESRTDLPGALALIAGAIEQDRTGDKGRAARSGQTFVVILSEFREGSADLTASLAKLPEGVKVLASPPGEASAANVAIVGLEPGRSVVVTGKTKEGAGAAAAPGSDQVRLTLQRSGPGVTRGGTSTLVLSMAGLRERRGSNPLLEMGRTVVHWAPGQETATAAVQATPPKGPATPAVAESGGQMTEVLEARLEGMGTTDNAVPGDDVWRRPVEVRDALRVGIVAPRRFGARERVDKLDAAEWLRLALRPGEEVQLEVTELEPALLDGARLAGLDAVCLPRPDMLAAEHWARLRLFLEGGGLVIVMPPSGVQVHLWPDGMVKEFGLGWRVAREAKAYEAGGGKAATIAPSAAGAAQPDRLLSQIQQELDDLARAVRVMRALPVETDKNEGQRLLTLSDGTPLLLVESYAGGAAAAPESAGGAGSPRPSDRGLIVYLAVAPELEWTDLPAKPLMVPLIQEIVREGVGRAHGSWWSIAGGRPATPSRTAELHPVELGRSGGRGEARSTPGAVVTVDELGTTSVPLRRAALWQALDERGGVRGVVAVNPDTRGSRTVAQERGAVEQWLARSAPDGKLLWVAGAAPEAEGEPSFAQLLARQSPGSPISLPLLIAALVLGVLEMWLARWASHATVAAPARRGVGVAA